MNLISPEIIVRPIHKTLWETDNVFTSQALRTLHDLVVGENYWRMDRGLERLSLRFSPENDKFQDFGEQLCQVVSDTVGLKLQYKNAKLFLDLPGSSVPTHHDSEDIAVMCQIYLTDNSKYPIPGTQFLEPIIHTVPYKYNCGYFNLNSDLKKHQSAFIKNTFRTSVGFQFCLPR